MSASGSNSGPGTADIELSTFTSFQQTLHYDSEVYAPFSRPGSSGVSDKSSWNTPNYDQLRSGSNSDGEMIYHVNKMYDFLGKINYDQILPEISVLPKYRANTRICWPSNLPHMICYEASLKVNDKIVQSFTTESFDAHYQMFCTDKASYNMCVGNIEILNQWTDHLPTFPICWEMPWFCGTSESYSIPITLCREASWTFNLHIRTNIESLLRIQRLDKNGVWKSVKFHSRWFIQCEQGKNVTVRPPRLFGSYAKIPSVEKMFMHVKTPWNGKMHLHDYMTISSDNPQTLGEKVALELPCPWPVTDIFIVSENVTATKYNNTTNRGTHPTNGVWSPFKNVIMSYGGSQKFSLPHYHLERGALRNMYPGKPTEPGFLVYPLCVNPATTEVSAGRTLSLHKATMSVELGDTNPLARDITKVVNNSDDDVISSDDENEAQSSEASTKGYPGEKEVRESKFRVHVLLRHTRELVFIKDKAGFYTNCQVTQQPQIDNVGTDLMEQINKTAYSEMAEHRKTA